jgi:hypothetical protein
MDDATLVKKLRAGKQRLSKEAALRIEELGGLAVAHKMRGDKLYEDWYALHILTGWKLYAFCIIIAMVFGALGGFCYQYLLANFPGIGP